MERHLYYNMAQMARCFNFAWSRWNLTAGRRSIVMQMREYIPTKSKQVYRPSELLKKLPLKYIGFRSGQFDGHCRPEFKFF